MAESTFIFEYPIKHRGFFLMSSTSFEQFKKENPFFENQLIAIGIKYKVVSSDFIKLQYR